MHVVQPGVFLGAQLVEVVRSAKGRHLVAQKGTACSLTVREKARTAYAVTAGRHEARSAGATAAESFRALGRSVIPVRVKMLEGILPSASAQLLHARDRAVLPHSV